MGVNGKTLVTVNGGTVRKLVYNGKVYLVELMGPGFSTHPTQIVSVYKRVGAGKVELSYWKSNRIPCTRIYYYRNPSDLQAYTSRGYTFSQVPKKYSDLLEIAMSVYVDVFGDQ